MPWGELPAPSPSCRPPPETPPPQGPPYGPGPNSSQMGRGGGCISKPPAVSKRCSLLPRCLPAPRPAGPGSGQGCWGQPRPLSQGRWGQPQPVVVDGTHGAASSSGMGAGDALARCLCRVASRRGWGFFPRVLGRGVLQGEAVLARAKGGGRRGVGAVARPGPLPHGARRCQLQQDERPHSLPGVGTASRRRLGQGHCAGLCARARRGQEAGQAAPSPRCRFLPRATNSPARAAGQPAGAAAGGLCRTLTHCCPEQRPQTRATPRVPMAPGGPSHRGERGPGGSQGPSGGGCGWAGPCPTTTAPRGPWGCLGAVVGPALRPAAMRIQLGL